MDIDAAFLLDSVKARLLRRERMGIRVGRFDLVRRLGQGGMGVVYEAVDPELGERVALKLLRRATPGERDRLRREFRAASHLSHPNLLRLYELSTHESELYFTMELVRGVDLLDAASHLPRGDAGPLLDLLRGLARALRHLHEHRTIHCDVKPANVLVEPCGRVVLLDFGLAQDVLQTRARLRLVGTPPFMAPELQGGGALTTAVDVYAFGVMVLAASFAWLEGEAAPTILPDPGALGPVLGEAAARIIGACLDPDPAARPDLRQVCRVLGVDEDGGLGPGEVPVVGREVELALLQRSSAPGVCIAVRGPSGIGKTTLVEEATRRLTASGWTVWRSRCYERESVPFRGVDALLDQLAAHLGDGAAVPGIEPDELAALRALFPSLASAPALRKSGPVPEASPEGGRHHRRAAFSGVRRLVQHLAEQRPLAIWVDDLQWCDGDSAALVRALLQKPRARVAVILSLRPGGLVHNGAARELVESEVTETLDLGPLGDAAASELLAALLPGREKPSDAQRREAAGSPFLLRELAAYIQEERHAPASLREVVGARVGRLSDRARQLLEVVGLAGQPIALPTAVSAARVGASASECLAELRSNGLAVLEAVGSDPVVSSRHDRVRETVVASIDQGRRAVLHQRLATALEQAGAGSAALAHHYAAAGDYAAASRHAEAGAREARRVFAFDQSAILWTLAVRVTDRPSRELLLQHAEALERAGRSAEAAAAFLRLSEQHEGQERLVLRRKAAHQLLAGGSMDRGRELLAEVLPHYGIRLPGSPARAAAELLLLRTRLFARGLGYVERPESAIPREDLDRLDACASAAEGLLPADMVTGACLNVKYTLLALEAGEPQRLARALAVEAGSIALAGPRVRGRVEEMLAHIERLVAGSRDPSTRAQAIIFAATARLLLGDPDRAARDVRQAGAILESAPGMIWVKSSYTMILFSALLMTGRFAEYCRLADRVLADVRDGSDLLHRVSMRSWTHIAMIARGDPDGARREIAAIQAEWPNKGFSVQNVAELSGGARVALYEGDGPAALDCVNRLWGSYRRSLIGQTQRVRMDVVCWRGRAAVATYARTRDRRVKKQAMDAARRLRREDFPGVTAWADLLMAGLAQVEGETLRAVSLLRTAQKVLCDAGQRLECASARHILGHITDDPEMLRLAHDYFTREEIAEPPKMARMMVPGFE